MGNIKLIFVQGDSSVTQSHTKHFSPQKRNSPLHKQFFFFQVGALTESIHWHNPSMEDTNYFIFLAVILVLTSGQSQGGCLTLWGRLTSATESLDLPIITCNPVAEHPDSFSSVSILCSLSFGCLNHLIPLCFHRKEKLPPINLTHGDNICDQFMFVILVFLYD